MIERLKEKRTNSRDGDLERDKKKKGQMKIREVLKGKEIKKGKNEKKRIVTIEIYENKAGKMQQE